MTGRHFAELRVHIISCDEAGAFCGCEAAGAAAFRRDLRKALAARGLTKQVKLTVSHCNQPGAIGPVLAVYPAGVWYEGLTADDIPRFIDEQINAGRPLPDKLYPRPIVTGNAAY